MRLDRLGATRTMVLTRVNGSQRVPRARRTEKAPVHPASKPPRLACNDNLVMLRHLSSFVRFTLRASPPKPTPGRISCP